MVDLTVERWAYEMAGCWADLMVGSKVEQLVDPTAAKKVG